MPQGDHIRFGIALGEGGHDPDDLSAGVREELPEGEERAARRDDVVDDHDPLALEAKDIVRTEEERLLLVRRDALHANVENRLSQVGLLLLPGDDGRELRLAAEDVEEGQSSCHEN